MVPHNPPRPPPYAWDWLQRSRPVLQALSQRLTGQAPSPGFVDELRDAFAEDPFVYAVVVDTIADVAFGGRVPRHRPPGVAWDRGLSWWAATLAGTTRREFERPGPAFGEQVELFPTDEHGARQAPQGRSGPHAAPGEHANDPAATGAAGSPRPSAVITLERRRLANALRALLDSSGGKDIPAEAVRRLIHDLDASG